MLRRFSSRILKPVVLSAVLAAVLATSAAAFPQYSMHYVYREGENQNTAGENSRIYIPQTYTVSTSFSFVDDENGMTSFNQAQDLFIDEQDNLYVADTENNRVVVLDAQGNTKRIFTQGGDLYFVRPQGVFVDGEGSIYVADTGNARIVKLTPEGETAHIYEKPDSPLLNQLESFSPTKVAMGVNDCLYVLIGNQFMSIDSNNEFKGYLGATRTSFSLSALFIKWFASQEQKEAYVPPSPPPCNDLAIDDQGRMIVCSNDDSDQIRIINSLGNNIYKSGFYGEVGGVNDQNEYINPNFTAITVDQNSVISAIDRNSGRIYQYDGEGNLLAVFAGHGDNAGYFDQPAAIACDSQGNLFVLDSVRNNIQKFEPTGFIEKVHEASRLYFAGEYDRSMELWQEITRINAEYPLARNRLGSVYYKQGDYTESMRQYTLADDMDGYSMAFDKYIHQVYKQYFVVIVVVAVVLVVGLMFLILYLRRLADKVRDNAYLRRGRHI